MPRANRYVLAGRNFHVTHRCHDRRFLFKFGVCRTEYRRRLRVSLKRYDLSLLAYCITSNHTHLLINAASTGELSAVTQQLEGEFAQWYNRRKRRSGAFWDGRYHARDPVVRPRDPEQAPLGNGSCGAKAMEKYIIKAEPKTFAFTIMPF